MSLAHSRYCLLRSEGAGIEDEYLVRCDASTGHMITSVSKMSHRERVVGINTDTFPGLEAMWPGASIFDIENDTRLATVALVLTRTPESHYIHQPYD